MISLAPTRLIKLVCHLCSWSTYRTIKQSTRPTRRHNHNETSRKLIWATSRPQSEKINHGGNAVSVFITTFKTWLLLHMPHPIMLMICRSDHRPDTWLTELCQKQSFTVPERASARPVCNGWHSISIFRLRGKHSLLNIKAFEQQLCSMKISSNFIAVFSQLGCKDHADKRVILLLSTLSRLNVSTLLCTLIIQKVKHAGLTSHVMSCSNYIG